MAIGHRVHYIVLENLQNLMKQILEVFCTVIVIFLITFCSPAPTDEVVEKTFTGITITPTIEQSEENTDKPSRKITTSTPEPTTTPKPIKISDIVFFDSAEENRIIPEDVLEEISYFAGGGPGGTYCDRPYATTTIEYDPPDSELMQETEMVTCGWASKQDLIGEIIYPDGKTVINTLIADAEGVGILSFTPFLSDPEGIYEFKISGNGIILKSNAYFRKPIVPRMYILPDNQLLLNNFSPGERVRLFMYACIERSRYDITCDFEAWGEYIIPNDGNLLINITDNTKYYRVVTSSGIEIDTNPLIKYQSQ